MTYKILHGNNLDILPTLPDNSVDSIVTDPPYELGFMGKKWDSSGIAYSVELWQQCLRVLKPGGHLLSFGGTRTWHRVAVAIEDAGFEIRDNIARFYGDPAYCQCELPQLDWVYGTGEPQTQHSMRSMPDGNLPPTLDPANQQGQVLQSEMQEQGTSSTQRAEPKQGSKDGKEPSLEGRGDLQATQGQLLRCEVCQVSDGVSADGQERRLHHGAQACSCQANRQDANSDRSSESQGPQSQQQSSEQSGTLPNQRGSQKRRGWPICVGCGKPVSTTNAGHMAWVMGSGFPKSLDVSKAIDKGQGQNLQRQLQFVNWMRTTGLKQQQINTIIGKADVGSHYLRLDQPAIATADLFDKLRPYLPEVPEEIERLVAERTGIEWTEYKNRAVIGVNKKAELKDSVYFGNLEAAKKSGRAIGYGEFDITAPSTPEAQQWQGWGTALKPAFEPIVVARKPIEGTVANNVLKWGTGGLNIDGSRIGTEERTHGWAGRSNALTQERTDAAAGIFAGNGEGKTTVQGRWPANLIIDEHTAELLDEQTTDLHGAGNKKTGHYHSRSEFGGGQINVIHNDTGGASRFFYVAKASKRDRNEGLDELLETTAADMVDREPDSAGMNSPTAGAGRTSGAKNFHPTVKPTTLMEYLIKLVTPPGGVVLDPFTGSGSTGKAAILQGFDFIGIEMTEEYLPIIEGRLKHAEAMVAEAKEQDKAKENEVLF